MDPITEILDEIPSETADAAKAAIFENWNAKAESAMDRQREIAKQNASENFKSVNGIGEMVLSVDPQIYHFWNWKVPGCWRDSDFIRWFKRNFPECVVKCGGTGKSMFLMPGLRKTA